MHRKYHAMAAPAIAFAALALLFLPRISFAAPEYQVGVSPTIVSLGEIARGKESVGAFYIVTASAEDILVKLEAARGSSAIFGKPEYSKFISAYSEEDASRWIIFPSNPVTLSPQDDSVKTQTGTLQGWRKINFVVRVPKDAEPGYHVVSIRPAPYVPEGRGMGVNVAAVSIVTVIFRVPGDAVRSGTVLDITAGKYSPAGTMLDVFFKNTGTVTISSTASEVSLYNSTKDIILTKASGSYLVKPGSVGQLSVVLDAGKVLPATYGVSASVQYLTGSATKNSEITFEGSAEPVVPAKTGAPGSTKMPLWLFAVPVLLFIIAMYLRREDARERKIRG